MEDAPVSLAYNATERGGSPAKAQCEECRSSLRIKIWHVREVGGVNPDSAIHRVQTIFVTTYSHGCPVADLLSGTFDVPTSGAAAMGLYYAACVYT